jgi:hypothetical protein
LSPLLFYYYPEIKIDSNFIMEFEELSSDIELEDDLDNENELEDDLDNENSEDDLANENVDENTDQNITRENSNESINSKKKSKSYVYLHFTLNTKENRYKCNHCRYV